MTSGVSGAGALLVCATGDVRSLPASGRRARNRSRPLSGSASAWTTGPASRCLRQIATDENISERVIRKRAKGDDWSRGWSERNLEKREGGSARTAGTEWLANWRAGRRRRARGATIRALKASFARGAAPTCCCDFYARPPGAVSSIPSWSWPWAAAKGRSIGHCCSWCGRARWKAGSPSCPAVSTKLLNASIIILMNS